MFELIFLFLGLCVSAVVAVAFGAFNIYSNMKEEKRNRQWHVVRYRPVIPPKPIPKPVPEPKPEPKSPQKKYLTVEEFVKKNLNLLDKLIQENKNFTLSEEILKDLDDKGRAGLADWFMNMKTVTNVINNTAFKVFMISP